MSGRKVNSMSELHESAVRQSHTMTLASATEITRRRLEEASRLCRANQASQRVVNRNRTLG
jgi:hypothetical protein